MEHRYYHRTHVNLAVQLATCDGKVYYGQLREISATGMQIMLDTVLPDRVKVVDVSLIDCDSTSSSKPCQRMLLARKQGRVLGLCLMNEQDQIDTAWYHTERQEMIKARKRAI